MDADGGCRSALENVPRLQQQQASRPGRTSQQQEASRPGRTLVITGSGFHGAAKQELQRLVQSIGGAHSGDLVQGFTTHLVCKRLIDCFGTPKYQGALACGVSIVSYEWLLASSAAGRPLPEQDYTDDRPEALGPSPFVGRKHLQRTIVQEQPPQQQPQLPVQPHEASDLQLQHEQTDQSPLRQRSLQPSPAAATSRLKQQQQEQPGGRTGSSSPKTIQLQQLPADFLLQQDDCFAFNLHQVESVQQQEQEMESPFAMGRSTWIRQIAVAASLAADGKGSAGDAPGSSNSSFNFQQQRSPASQQTSPCIQHFRPLQQQQQELQELQQGRSAVALEAELQLHPFQESSEIQVGGIAGAEATAKLQLLLPPSPTTLCQAPPLQQQQEQLELELQLTVKSSQESDAASADGDVPGVVTVCGLAAAVASAVEGLTGTQDDAGSNLLSLLATVSSLSGSEASSSDSDTELVIDTPGEAAADEDSTAAAVHGAADGSQSEDVREDSDDAGADPATGDAAPAGDDAPDELETADEVSTEEDSTEAPEEAESAAGPEPAVPEPAGDACIELLVPETQAELLDPWAAVAAAQEATPMSLKHYANQQARAAQLQQQQQQEVAAATSRPGTGGAPDGTASRQQQQQQQQGADVSKQMSCQRSGGSSSRSGLQRLRRKDGYRRCGRVLVSQPPDPSEMQELQDSDCEEQDLADSDCSAGCQQALSSGAGWPQVGGSSMRCGVADSGMAGSPVQSCSGSSMPAHSRPYSSSSSGPGPCAASAAPATPGSVSASAGPLPVVRLSFSEQQQHSSLTGGSSGSGASGGSSGSARSGRGSGVDSRGGRLQLKARPSASAANASTAAALLQKQQQLKQQQQQQQQKQQAAAGLLSPPSAGSLFVTRRKCGKPAQTAGPAEAHIAAVADAFPFDAQAAAAASQPVNIKQEAVDVQQQQQLDAVPAGAEVLLQDLRQQQRRQRQQQQAAVKREDGAEALLNSIRSKQQQQRHGVAAAARAAALPAAEGIDDSTQVAGAAAAPAAARAQTVVRAQAAAGRPSTSSYTSHASFATDMSSVSRKVPLTFVGGGMQLLPGDDEAAAAGAEGSSRGCGALGASPLDKLLQQALADTAAASRQLPVVAAGVASAGGVCDLKAPLLQDRCSNPAAVSAAAAAAAGVGAAATVPVKQEQQDGSCWLHTPEEAQQQQQQRRQPRAAAAAAADTAVAGGYDSCNNYNDSHDNDDEAFEITELPTGHLAARGRAMSRHLGARLAHLTQAEGREQVIALKLLAKTPRGSTAKAHHGLRSSSKLVFAEQVQVPWAHATFSTKERSKCMIVREQPGVSGSHREDVEASPNSSSSSSSCGQQPQEEQQQQAKVYLAEPVAFYKLENGEWWVELQRFFSARDLRLLAKAAGSRLSLPADFQLDYELLRGMTHLHVSMRQVQGEFKLSKVRKAPAAAGGGRSQLSPFFWRFSIDPATFTLLTDRPVTDFVVA